MTTPTTIRLGARDYRVVGPSRRDPRLHLALVIISVHVLGQVALGFRVSLPQILVAILTPALIEVAWTWRRTGVVVWPASAMLTGSGLALILRLVGMEARDPWSWRGWHIYALVAAVSLLSKYLLRRGGTHLFNPSNFGLVAAFLVLGSGVIEPLDFWWAPFGPALILAYGVILGGGLAITGRLRLLGMALVFWLTLAAGLGLLAFSGHCITAAWALEPVCGADFWWVVVTSPEVLVFLFFMITDPKTIPVGERPRLLFAAAVAALGTLLIAPQATEFGAKVGLLAGLVLLTPLRARFERVSLPALAPPNGGGSPLRLLARGAALGSGVGLLAAAVVLAGIPARGSASPASPRPVIEVAVDPPRPPAVVASDGVSALNSAEDPERIGAALVGALSALSEAMSRSDLALLRTVAAGEYLVAVEGRIEAAAGRGEVVVPRFEVDRVSLDVAFLDGPQGGVSLAATVAGTVEEVVYDTSGGELRRSRSVLDTTYLIRPDGEGSVVIVAERGASDR